MDGISSTYSDSWRAKSIAARTAALRVVSASLASRCSKLSISSTGAGRRKSTGRNSRICSDCSSSDQKSNAILLGNVGLGKTHLLIALGHTACLRGYSVHFTTAIDIIHTLSAATGAGDLKRAMQRYLKPSLLLIDEVGYLPIDKLGADLLFQIISTRYERGAIVLSTNRAYKKWPEIFNNDSTLTSAILDRLLHRCETAVIEGKSYRAKDRVEEP